MYYFGSSLGADVAGDHKVVVGECEVEIPVAVLVVAEFELGHFLEGVVEEFEAVFLAAVVVGIEGGLGFVHGVVGIALARH